MKIHKFQLKFASMGLTAALAMVAFAGCSQQEAEDAVKQTGESVEQAAQDVADGASEMVEQGKAMAGDMADKGKQLMSDLSEKAQGYVTSLKEEFGSLDALKEKPEELKNALSGLVQTMEDKAADINLPQSMADALAAAKEKIMALITYLEGEYEQSEISAKLAEIMESVKSALGME